MCASANRNYVLGTTVADLKLTLKATILLLDASESDQRVDWYGTMAYLRDSITNCGTIVLKTAVGSRHGMHNSIAYV